MLLVSRCSKKHARKSASRFDASFEPQPSTARPTGTPSSSISGTLHTPEANFILLTGLCDTPVLVFAKKPTSSSVK